MKSISTALVKAQKEFGTAHKTSNNPFFKSKYADLSVVVDAVLGALNNNGIALIQNCHESDTGVVVETVFLHESGESVSCGKLSVPAAKNDPQGYGSALTYARRYSLMAACGIAPEDDDGNAAVKAVARVPELKSVQLTDFDQDEQTFLKDTAIEIIAFVGEGKDLEAYELTTKLDNDEKLALWTLLDSKSRTSLKKSSQTQQLKAA